MVHAHEGSEAPPVCNSSKLTMHATSDSSEPAPERFTGMPSYRAKSMASPSGAEELWVADPKRLRAFRLGGTRPEAPLITPPPWCELTHCQKKLASAWSFASITFC